MVFPSSNIIQAGTTSDGLLYYDIVTPRVQSVVRNHFNCQSLNGARLEIQDTSATACVGSHWDERLFLSELMSPVFSGTADVLSPLTLALMEDSGWYQVNYGNSQLSPFGQGAGCKFVNDLCIVNDAVPIAGKGYFCTKPTVVRSDGSVYINDNDVLCDPSHIKMTVCSLFDKTQVPSSFSLTSSTGAKTLTYFSDKNWVGTFEEASFCPMPTFSTSSFRHTLEKNMVPLVDASMPTFKIPPVEVASSCQDASMFNVIGTTFVWLSMAFHVSTIFNKSPFKRLLQPVLPWNVLDCQLCAPICFVLETVLAAAFASTAVLGRRHPNANVTTGKSQHPIVKMEPSQRPFPFIIPNTPQQSDGVAMALGLLSSL